MNTSNPIQSLSPVETPLVVVLSQITPIRLWTVDNPTTLHKINGQNVASPIPNEVNGHEQQQISQSTSRISPENHIVFTFPN